MEIYFSRQPIFDAYSNTAGYQLSFRYMQSISNDTPENRTQHTYDVMKQYFPVFFTNKFAVIKFTKDLILYNAPAKLNNKNLFIEISARMMYDKEILEKCFSFKRAGIGIVLTDYIYEKKHDELFRFANMVKIPANAEQEALRGTVKQCAAAGKSSFVYGVSDYAMFEKMVDEGCTFITGDYYTSPVLDTKQSGGPMIRTFLQIIAMVYSPEPDIEKISMLISTDPVLTIRLLKQINSVFEGKSGYVSTVLQALVMLGLDRIKQWVYLVGLKRLNRDAPGELLRTSLFRAFFCERIARLVPSGRDKSKELYLMGLLSAVIGVNSGNDEIFDELPVSEDIRQGLIGGDGFYSDVFNLVLCYENARWEELEVLTDKLGIDRQSLAEQYLTSLRFCNNLSG